MANFDFDFLRYVERKKGARETAAREGAAWAYSGDLKVLRTLDKLRPVTLAVEGTVRLWRASARAELLGPAVKVSETRMPKLHAAAVTCGERLHVDPPEVWVTPGELGGGTLSSFTFGTDDDPAIVLHASLAERLTGAELLDVVGRELGHLQNHHVRFLTALYFLEFSAGSFLRWIVKPATFALAAWAARADVTADRAGLLCSRDLDASLRVLPLVARRAVDDTATPPATADPRRRVQQRAEALKIFASSAFYTGLSGAPTGATPEDCDRKVAEVLK